MKPLATAAACVALALLSFFQFPGHTWLQQDSQIYTPILEHLRDPAVLRNDILVQRPHVAFTLYDETAIVLRALTRAGFREVLAAQQLATRALGIWGLLMMAAALGLGTAESLLVLHMRARRRHRRPRRPYFRIRAHPARLRRPLVICAMASPRRRLSRRRHRCRRRFLYHPPTALPLGHLPDSPSGPTKTGGKECEL